MGYTAISDVIVPSVFAPYVQTLTEEKSKLIASTAMAPDAQFAQQLAGGGLLFQAPSWKDLDNTAANASSDNSGSSATPLNIGTFQEKYPRVSRNQVWGAADLAGELAGSDPMNAIANRIAAYWAREFQRTAVAILKGIFADNAANDSGDMTKDISGAGYTAGVTDFSAEAFIDMLDTIGDSEEDLVVVIMHSKVFNRARKNNLIDFVSDSTNPNAIRIPTFLGRMVLVDDTMPKTGNIYTTYAFGSGFFRFAEGRPKVPVAVDRNELQGNGAGTEFIVTRREFCMHPRGFSYVGSSPNSGPTNGTGANEFGAAASWNREVPERKQAKVASLITREA